MSCRSLCKSCSAPLAGRWRRCQLPTGTLAPGFASPPTALAQLYRQQAPPKSGLVGLGAEGSAEAGCGREAPGGCGRISAAGQGVPRPAGVPLGHGGAAPGQPWLGNVPATGVPGGGESQGKASYLVWEVFLQPRVLGESEGREGAQSHPPSEHPRAGGHVGQGQPRGTPPAQTRQICPSPHPSTAWQEVPALTCSQTSKSSTCEQGTV